MNSDPYASGVLRPDVHDRIVANLTQIAMRAGLGMKHRHLIWTTAELKKAEMQWCEAAIRMSRANLPWDQAVIGLCYTKDQAAAEQTMMEMTGLLVRNFVDARCLSRMELVSEQKSGGVEGSVILCPDFAMPEYVDTMPPWERASMADFIHERSMMAMPTCLFVGSSWDSLKAKLPTVVNEIQSNMKVENA
jgi:hypothetical protein